MECKAHDFIWNPVVQNQVFFIKSKCALCGFSVLTRSIEELMEREKRHRAECGPSDAAA
jgi:hypothetical protein